MSSYISELSSSRTGVRCQNRYGMEIAGGLYIAKRIGKSKQYPAPIVDTFFKSSLH